MLPGPKVISPFSVSMFFHSIINITRKIHSFPLLFSRQVVIFVKSLLDYTLSFMSPFSLFTRDFELAIRTK